jgi:hypothetical protein
MAFPHPKSGEDHSRNDDEPNPGGVVWKSFERTIDIAEYRNGKDDVNPANNRTFGGIFHDEFVLRLSAISASFTPPAVGTPMGMSTDLEEPLKPKAGFHPSQRKPRCLGTRGLNGPPADANLGHRASSASLHDFSAASGGQLGVSTPNCLAYSACSRCQPPNFIASGPTMRPMGVPLSR